MTKKTKKIKDFRLSFFFKMDIIISIDLREKKRNIKHYIMYQ
eukprot:UN08703